MRKVMHKKANLLGLEIDCLRKEQLTDVFNFEGKQIRIIKVNTEFLARALKDKKFFDTLKGSDVLIADGKGVLWTAKYLSLPLSKLPGLRVVQAFWQTVYTGASLVFYPPYCRYPIEENIPGMEAFKEMMTIAQESEAGVFILGATDETLEKAISHIKLDFPQIKIAGSHHGFDDNNEKIIKEINDSKAKVLIVAMGSPKQEYWIEKYGKSLKTVKVAVGEGGTLEFLAGEFRRAPRWMQQLSLEWLWRLLFNRSKTQTGSRLIRVWNAVPSFIYQIVKYKIKSK